ncbi:sigma-70 family RNA polymerase sigma factor [Asticcacaulis solisilvae]|uniref:sigma-70 family RNA polymerase sigma factor n=1 Tax=Asticcacaulis solisilvae TaxID=1217274 RepID=UPI003FD7A090
MTFDHISVIGFAHPGMDTDTNPLRDTTPDLPPERLIARIAEARDRAAYAALFTRFAPRLKAFVMGQGLPAQEAEDLAQDAMLNVWRKAHLFDPARATAVTWIYSIARNLRIDAARKAKRVRDLPDDLWQGEGDKPADQELIDHQSARSVSALIRALPADQQTVLKMSFYEDLSHGDIARALSLPLGTVKSRLRLALTRLKTALAVPGGRA